MKKIILDQEIIKDKINGLSDEEIGNKYNVSFKYIERVITKEKGINISDLKKSKKIKSLFPENFKLENNTVWSFKSRGNWATHNGSYRGNWSPYIPRNIILRYSKENDIVLDYFCGSGTTAVECKLLNRNFIGLDINEKAIELTRKNIDFDYLFSGNIELRVGDARNLSFLKDDSIDLICTHPPYANIIKYTFDNKSDLSHLDVDKFLNEIEKVAKESYRVLKKEKYCGILIGDLRKNKYIIPLGFWTIEKYLNSGFVLKEIIIKRQHNCKTTGFWYKNSIKFNFLLLAHEYLAIFKKTDQNKNVFIEKIIGNIVYNINKELYLESTTVWIFKKENYIDKIISNLSKRYSENFCIYNNEFKFDANLIIYFFDKNFYKFLDDIKNVKEGSIIAIISEDRRIENGLINSEALLIEKEIRTYDYLKIREIIIIVLENNINNVDDINLNINHKYLLLYIKED